MMNAQFFLKRLDDSNGTVKNSFDTMTEMSEQPPKMPWFLRIQEALDLQGLARAIGLGLLSGAILAASPPYRTPNLKYLIITFMELTRTQRTREDIF